MKSEQELAAYYQRHKDDPDLWEEDDGPEPDRAPKMIGLYIAVDFELEEAADINRVAEKSGLTYTQLVRRAVLSFVRKGGVAVEATPRTRR